MAKKKELRKKYGLTKKDIKRYRKWCGGEIAKKWQRCPDEMDMVLVAITRMSYEHRAILLGFSELSPTPKSGTVKQVPKGTCG